VVQEQEWKLTITEITAFVGGRALDDFLTISLPVKLVKNTYIQAFPVETPICDATLKKFNQNMWE
jgi:peroxiredoxin